jgi:hypothetical protein
VRKVQRLFGNAYGPTYRHLAGVGDPGRRTGGGRNFLHMKPQTGWLALAAVVVAATSLLPTIAGHAVATPAPLRTQVSLAPAYINLNSSPPGGQIVFGQPLPEAEIVPKDDSPVAATLGLQHLLEIAPNASNPEHPTVLAEAAPLTLQQYNSSSAATGTPYLRLIATLPVLPAKTALWTDGTTIVPASGVAQQAILEVNYTVVSGSDGSPGVIVSWTVSGWPWVNSLADELALEYVVQVVSGSGFETCSGAPSTDAPDATCSTEPLAQGQAVWGSTLTALRGNGPEGSVAWVSWNSQVSGSTAAAAPVSAGAYFEQPGTSALAIAAPDGGASLVTGSTLFLLSPGNLGGTLAPLGGSWPAYGGAAAVFAIGAVAGVWLSRRRDQAIARDLAA